MKVLIVGLGSMGKRRIRMLLRLMPSNCIFGVDTQQARRDEVSQLYEVASYDDLQNAFSAQVFDRGFTCTYPLGQCHAKKAIPEASLSVFSEINYIITCLCQCVGQWYLGYHPQKNCKELFMCNRSANVCREIVDIMLPWPIYTFGEIDFFEIGKKNLSHFKADGLAPPSLCSSTKMA